MTQINWNELRDRAYKIAKEHGFHEGTESTGTALMLVITELSEAVEADRKNRHADIRYFKLFQEKMQPENDRIKNECFKADFEKYIKDSVEDELADAAIRLLDLAGTHNINIEYKNIYPKVFFARHSFPETALEMTGFILLIGNDLGEKNFANVSVEISAMLSSIFDWCQYLNIDILWHIEQKMRYNELREYKHGKEY